jgi:sugar phosphate isomerase/epimerase
MPGGLWPGVHGFLSLCAELGSASLGYNFDTGHAWSCKEWVPGTPAVAGARLVGTHLKDNLQHENLALAPGAGTIPWPPTLKALADAGYRGSWDLEFRCPAELATEQYARALGFVRPLVETALAAPPRS